MGDLESRNKAVVLRFGDALNSRRLDLLNELLASGFVRHCQATPWAQIRSREDFLKFIEDDWAAVPDSRTTVRSLVAEDDRVAFHNTYSGTQTGPWGPLPASGKRIELDTCGIFRLDGGRIVELWVTWDNVAALTQLGHMPPIG